MSNEALLTQAIHTLNLIAQKSPTKEHLRKLHDGLLSDLMDAIVGGTIPDREKFRASIGLLPSCLVSESEIIIDPIIRVDRSIRPSYFNWVATVMHPELENTGPAEYDIAKTEQWLHEGQKNGKLIEGKEIYFHLKSTGDLKNHCGLRDLEEIQKKGIAFFRKYLKNKEVFAWRGVVRSYRGDLLVPYLCCERRDEVVLRWRWLGCDWSSCYPGLRHTS